MKNARIMKNGVLTIDFGTTFHPSDEIDPSNPFIRKKIVLVATTRECKLCGKKFVLHGDYDKENPTHDLCDDCILNAPPSSDQQYSDKTIQIEQMEIDASPQEFLSPGDEILE